MPPLGHGSNAIAPGCHHFVVPVGVWTVPQQATDVVQYDGQVGHGFGEIRQLGHLGEEHPTLQGQPHARQNPGACPEIWAAQLTFHIVGGCVFHVRVGVPSNGVAYAAKPVGASRLKRFQHRFNSFAQVQVGVTDYGCGSTAGTVKAGCAGCGQPLDEFNFADGAHLLRPVSTVHRPCLNKHGRTHVVTAVNVIGQLVKQIPLKGNARGAEVPEVVVRIADWDFRLQCLLLGQSEPVIASEWHNSASMTEIVPVLSGPIVSHRRNLTRYTNRFRAGQGQLSSQSAPGLADEADACHSERIEESLVLGMRFFGHFAPSE